MKLSPFRREVLFFVCLVFYAAAVLYAARPSITFEMALFILSVLSFITFVIATAALILKK